MTAAVYWEDRARRFAAVGRGLRAVCSFGMPAFYNGYIHLLQSRALAPVIRVRPGSLVLEIGCGVARWGRKLAASGARVTGVDLAPAMVTEARRRAIAEGVDERCEFQVGDVSELRLDRQFDLILSVTVLQHIVEVDRLDSALIAMARHLVPGGRIVLLEAAPTSGNSRCNTEMFLARAESVYRDAFARAGLRCVTTMGVDPVPLKTWLIPVYRRLPRVIALTALFGATAISLPFDLAFGHRLTRRSWHKVFVLAAA